VAIDGHNLIAVRQFRGEDIDVIIAESSTDGLPPTTEANVARNEELAAKYVILGPVWFLWPYASSGVLTSHDYHFQP
jgi:hypothetical protein